MKKAEPYLAGDREAVRAIPAWDAYAQVYCRSTVGIPYNLVASECFLPNIGFSLPGLLINFFASSVRRTD